MTEMLAPDEPMFMELEFPERYVPPARAVISCCPCGAQHEIKIASPGWSVKCLVARQEFSLRVNTLLPCDCADTWQQEPYICFSNLTEDEARDDGQARFHCRECHGRGDIHVSGGESKHDPLGSIPEVRRPCSPCGASGLVWGEWLGW